jgi:hypothetical protein
MSVPSLDVEPMGYRRVLMPEESAEWHRRLEGRWGLDNLSWHPMLEGPVPEDVLILKEASAWDRHGVAAYRFGQTSRRARSLKSCDARTANEGVVPAWICGKERCSCATMGSCHRAMMR